MTKPNAINAPNEESFTFVLDRPVPANRHMVHHVRDSNRANWYSKIEWITPDALPAGAELHFKLSLLPGGIPGVVLYTSPSGIRRRLVVHIERAVMQ